MRYFLIALIAAAFVACQGSSERQVSSLDSDKDSLSYSVGVQVGGSLKLGADDMDIDVFIQGIRDGLNDEDNLLSEEETGKNLTKFQQLMRTKFQEEQTRLGEENKTKGEEFLAENKTKEGVVELPSGLQYKVIQAGSGASPKATDRVVTHYRGTLLDGTQFDSSYDRGEPATFGVNQVIKGWTEALQLMKTGGKWELYIPSDLAYGPRGSGQKIPPNSALVFEIELLEIK